MEDFSIESLYEIGLGFSPRKTENVNSDENWDGDNDALVYEIASTEAMLDTLDLYGYISAFNASQQISCAHRISANYGRCNRGIESFCRNIIQSVENEEDDEPKEEKKQNIFQKFFHLIGAFLKKIFKAIQRAFTRIADWITGKTAEKNDGKMYKSVDQRNEERDREEKLEKEKRINELNELVEAVESFKREFRTLEPIHSSFVENLEKFSEIEVGDDRIMKCFKTFQKQCKVVSTYYQILLNASHKIMGYIKQYYGEVETNTKGPYKSYCKPNVKKIKRLGKDLALVLSSLNTALNSTVLNHKISENINADDYRRIYGGILKADNAISIFMIDIDRQNHYGVSRLPETDDIDGLLSNTNKYLSAIEAIKKDGIDQFLKDCFGIMAHYNEE